MQNTLTTIDTNRLTPFTVGFDEMFDRLYGIENNSVGFPPYNIIKVDDYQYSIEMALAVRSKKIDDDKFANSSIVHKGISTKCFERKFTLSDEVHVKSAEMKDGMLTIMLERIIPDHRKLKRISIK